MSDAHSERPLNRQVRLFGLSQPEVMRDWKRFALRAEEAGIKLNGRKVGLGPLLNAVVIHFLGQTEAEQERVARSGLAELEKMMKSSVPLAPGGSPKAAGPKLKVTQVPSPKAVGRKKGGKPGV